jgi:hypothetical protein
LKKVISFGQIKKLLASILLPLLLASACHAQHQQLYSQIFTDSVTSALLGPVSDTCPNAYKIFSRTDAWQLRRFYFKPPGPGQYKEGINIYAYNDTLLAMLISKDEWDMLAHKALAQKPTKIKHPPANVALVDDRATHEGDIFFSTTQPVFYKKWALIDMTYYHRDDERPLPEQWYQGQALFVFIKQSKHKWELIRVVNRFVL